MKKPLAALLCALCVFSLLTSCKKREEPGLEMYATTAKQTQVFTDPAQVEFTTAPTVQPPVTEATALNVDVSWMDNFILSYSFSQNGVYSFLTERRCAGIYSVTDNATGISTFFIQNGKNIEQYVLDPQTKRGSYSEIENAELAGLSTGFMKIAYLDPTFTTNPSVEYQLEEAVAGRAAKKYTQSSFSAAGLLTAYAFVWIDEEYGFASKCQVYNLTGSVNTSWELQSLEVGSVTKDSIGFSTEGYDISEG
ncbi:MAG: hypothetical protein IK118_09820 [Clostridia bacterium]|nr:hypothetical protein [Clostridia bacterium]